MEVFVVILISIILSAFFSGMEIAFVSSNKLKLQLATKENGVSSRILTILNHHPAQYISTMLVGNNLVLVIYGIYMAKILAVPISSVVHGEFYVLLLQTLISTFIILIFGEFLPKALFRIISNSALKTFSLPIVMFYYLFYPIVSFSIWLSRMIMKIFANISIDAHEKERAFGKIDIDEIIDKSKIGNTVSQTAQELKFFQNAMDFSNIKLRECIIPRNDIKAISINTDIAELREKFIETGHSNIFVYSSNVDEIIGYINVKDIFKNPKDLKSIMRKALIVPETMSAKKLFEHLIKHNTSLAVVVDEFGSTSGMVTVEDIMEEIFGEFEDEHDTPEFNVQITAEGNYIISGRFEVDVFNEEYGFDLSESDEYETLAGYIMFHSGSFPKEGEIISISDDNKTYKFKMLKVHETKIERILLYDK